MYMDICVYVCTCACMYIMYVCRKFTLSESPAADNIYVRSHERSHRGLIDSLYIHTYIHTFIHKYIHIHIQVSSMGGERAC